MSTTFEDYDEGSRKRKFGRLSRRRGREMEEEEDEEMDRRIEYEPVDYRYLSYCAVLESSLIKCDQQFADAVNELYRFVMTLNSTTGGAWKLELAQCARRLHLFRIDWSRLGDALRPQNQMTAPDYVAIRKKLSGFFETETNLFFLYSKDVVFIERLKPNGEGRALAPDDYQYNHKLAEVFGLLCKSIKDIKKALGSFVGLTEFIQETSRTDDYTQNISLLAIASTVERLSNDIDDYLLTYYIETLMPSTNTSINYYEMIERSKTCEQSLGLDKGDYWEEHGQAVVR